MFPITISFGVLILLLITVLAMNTTRNRGKYTKSSDPADKEKIRRASRAHGNNLEHGLVVILLMLFYEVTGANAALLCSLATAYLLVRVSYAYGMLSKPGSIPMVVGAGLTYLIELILIVLVGINAFMS
ncbi:MAG: MAPEG family protein [Nevskiales bacterium]